MKGTNAMTTLPDEATMAEMAEHACDSVRDCLMDSFGGIIHDAIEDAILKVLGEDFANSLTDESQEAYMEIMMDLTSRIVVTTV
jgi:hypothetical protein